MFQSWVIEKGLPIWHLIGDEGEGKKTRKEMDRKDKKDMDKVEEIKQLLFSI
jgi:hypothetical protein